MGKILLTIAGANALANAHANGERIKVISYKQSSQDIALSSALTSADITAWREKPVDEIQMVNAESVQFKVDCPADQATDYTRILGLYLEDGTLYAVAQPSFPLPPNVRQVFTPVLSVNGQTALLDVSIFTTEESDRFLRWFLTDMVNFIQITKNSTNLKEVN